MAFDSQQQRRIMGHFATGVTVVAARREGLFVGMTANAVASLSLDPPLVLVAVDKRAQMHEHLHACKCFTINILSDAQQELSQRFAMRGPKETSDLKVSEAVTGAPLLDDALAWLDCRLKETLAGGDHDIFIGEIAAGGVREGRPLLYYCGKYRSLAD